MCFITWSMVAETCHEIILTSFAKRKYHEEMKNKSKRNKQKRNKSKIIAGRNESTKYMFFIYFNLSEKDIV